VLDLAVPLEREVVRERVIVMRSHPVLG
jgi:hypothetical protein